jgi:SAM-dependent methyltransferase
MIATETMRRDWDERAQKDSLYYIASWNKDWDEAEFFASGERDYATLVQPVLSKIQFDPAGKAMLEIGSGVGRMTRAFAKRFGHVVALDISGEMLRQGRALHPDYANIAWVQGDGAGLSAFQSASFDFAFSYIVFQHLPTKELVLQHVRDMLRVLRPGGTFLFHFCSRTRPNMNWKGRLAWGAVDRLRELWPGASVRLARRLGLDPLAAGHTWRGALISPREVLETIWECGGSALGVKGWESAHTWCYGFKHRDINPVG